MNKSLGYVRNQDSKLILSVTSKVLRDQLASIIAILQSKQVDLVELTVHQKPVCFISASMTRERLATGEVNLADIVPQL